MSAAYLNTGTLPTNTAVVNGAANMQPVAQPTFPGVQQPTQQTPQMPQMAMGNAPVPSAMPGFNIGGAPVANPGMNPVMNTGMPTTNPGINPGLNTGIPVTEPGINGINMPPTIGMENQASSPSTGSIGGNIDDILSNI